MPEIVAAHLERVASELARDLEKRGFLSSETFRAEVEPILAAALAACARESLQGIAEQVRTLKGMAEACDQKGMAETPQREWTAYQGKILAYDCVLGLLERAAGEKGQVKEFGG